MLNAPEGPTVGRGESKKKLIRKKKGKKNPDRHIIYSNLGYWQYWKKIIFDEFIQPTSFALICIPKGIRVRVRVKIRNPNSPGDWTYCLLVFWLVESSTWHSTHCFEVFYVAFTNFQSVTQPFPVLKLYLFIVWATYNMSLGTIHKYRKSHCNPCKIALYSYTRRHIWRTSQKNRKADECKSRKQHYCGTNREQKLTKAYDGSIGRLREFTNLYLEEIFAQFNCGKQLPFATRVCSPLVSCVSVVLHCSWGLLLAWIITFQDCIAETLTHRGPERRHFPVNLDQNAIFSAKNNCTAYANPELGLEIQLKILARQKADVPLHSHPIVWRRSTTKGSDRSRQKNVSGEMKRNGARNKR